MANDILVTTLGDHDLRDRATPLAGHAESLVQRHRLRRGMHHRASTAGMGDLGRFSIGRIVRRISRPITKPISRLGATAQRAIVRNAGTLQAVASVAPAFGPIGMATGAIIGTGTGLVMAHEQDKAERAALAAQQRAAARQAATEADAQAAMMVSAGADNTPRNPGASAATMPLILAAAAGLGAWLILRSSAKRNP